jgi:hypothetical protein
MQDPDSDDLCAGYEDWAPNEVSDPIICSSSEWHRINDDARCLTDKQVRAYEQFFFGNNEKVGKYNKCVACQTPKANDVFQFCMQCVCSTPDCEFQAIQHGKCMKCDLWATICESAWCWQCKSDNAGTIYCAKDTCSKTGSNRTRVHVLRSQQNNAIIPGHLQDVKSLCDSCQVAEHVEVQDSAAGCQNLVLFANLSAQEMANLLNVATRCIDQGGNRRNDYWNGNAFME